MLSHWSDGEPCCPHKELDTRIRSAATSASGTRLAAPTSASDWQSPGHMSALQMQGRCIRCIAKRCQAATNMTDVSVPGQPFVKSSLAPSS